MNRTFAHRKRWGAEYIDARHTRVRIWAPAIDQVELLCGNGAVLPMDRSGDGWFETQTAQLQPGTAYAFRLPDGQVVPDPAARAQNGSVHDASLLIDPHEYTWKTHHWHGRPWEEAIVYELHTGTFTEAGSFDGVQRQLDHLAGTGFTAIELMPVAQFGGERGWGYDGVLPYAPHRAYGGVRGIKRLVDAAHERGLMVLLDVVYNHFGPDGNYLHAYAPQFFDARRNTPWGAAIAFDQPAVRDFFLDNAIYWLEEYRFDGLRLDAINQIVDPSAEHILESIAKTVRATITDRHIHLTTEDDRNITRLHERDCDLHPTMYTGEWNDDFHHAAHVAVTGESQGYYLDYVVEPVEKLARALAEGYAFQGESSAYLGDTARGTPSAHLPPTTFINFIQNHDQVGNRAFGERLTALCSDQAIEALTVILLLGPHIPLVFMGEELAERRPFNFFTDFHGDLADAVREGRRAEFRSFADFNEPKQRQKIPDPNALTTFERSRIDWHALNKRPGKARHTLFNKLLALRRSEIVPHLQGVAGNAAITWAADRTALGVRWRLRDGVQLDLIANLGDAPCAAPLVSAGRVLYETAPGIAAAAANEAMPGWSVAVTINTAQLAT